MYIFEVNIFRIITLCSMKEWDMIDGILNSRSCIILVLISREKYILVTF